MKKILIYCLLILNIYSCKKDDLENTPSPRMELKDQPDAIALYDNNALGVYKGVLVGSSGIVKIVLNENETPVGYVFYTLDNGYSIRDTDYCSQTFQIGQGLDNILFDGKSTTFQFSVLKDGSNPTVSNLRLKTATGDDLPHVVILKETSYEQIICFEGKYNGNDEGTFNCVTGYGSIHGIANSDVDDSFYSYSGEIDSSQAFHGTIDYLYNATFSGTFYKSANNIKTMKGTWSDEQDNGKGSFYSTRVL